MISGLYIPQRGRILFDDRNLVGRAPHQVARFGIARTFQGIEVFGRLTVLEDVLLGRHVHWAGGAARVLLGRFERRETTRQTDEAERAIGYLS